MRPLIALAVVSALLAPAVAQAQPADPGSGPGNGQPIVLLGTIHVLEIGVGPCPTVDQQVDLPARDADTIVSTLTHNGGGYASSEPTDEVHRYRGVSVTNGQIRHTCTQWDGFTFLEMEITGGVFVAGL